MGIQYHFPLMLYLTALLESINQSSYCMVGIIDTIDGIEI